jgi:CubicO group peptidase (beta-lactamase class C family)
MSRPLHLLSVLIFLSALALIDNAGRGQTHDNTAAQIGHDWGTATPSEVNLDSDMIRSMLKKIDTADGYKNIKSLLIVKDGKLVVEEYYPLGDEREQVFKRFAPQELTSATKSVTSILIGMVIDQQLIKSIDERVATFFPEYSDIFADRDKALIRLRDLLTMQAGLSWDEWTYPYTDARNSHVQMLRSNDPIRYVFEQPVVAPAGTKFAYSSGISIVLGKIISKATGKRVEKFAEQFLFDPLGITDFYWGKYPGEIVQAGGGLFLRPRDMAKIGYLYLNGGRWRGTQIVSENWVEESTKDQVGAIQIPKVAEADGYGYQWWISSFKVDEQSFESFSARGRGGQFILVIPKLQIVAVFTSPPENPLTFQPLSIVQKYILPAALAK